MIISHAECVELAEGTSLFVVKINIPIILRNVNLRDMLGHTKKLPEYGITFWVCIRKFEKQLEGHFRP